MPKINDRQRAALLVIQAQGVTNPGSMVLAQALGYTGRVLPTLDALIRRGLIERFERTDIVKNTMSPYYSYRITPAGVEALK